MSDRPINKSALYRLVACDGKVAFDSLALAQKVAKRRRTSGKYRGQAPYRCLDCGKYHIGRQEKNPCRSKSG